MTSIQLGNWKTGGSTGTIALECTEAPNCGSLTATSISLESEHGGNKAKAELRLKSRIEIATGLLNNDRTEFLTLEEIRKNAKDAALDALEQKRRQFTDRLKDLSLEVEAGAQGQASFFGAGAALSANADATLIVTGAVRPTVLLEKVRDPEAILFEVHAKAEVSIATRVTVIAQDGGTEEKAGNYWLTLDVEIRESDLPSLEIKLDVPALDLKWPKLEFPSLDLNGLPLQKLARLLHLPMWHVPGVATDPTLQWQTEPAFSLVIDGNRRLSIQTTVPGRGAFTYKGAALFEIPQFSASLDNGRVRLDLSIEKKLTQNPQINFDRVVGPFAIKVNSVTLDYAIRYSSATSKVEASVTCTIGRVQVSSVSDPGLVIAADLTFIVRAALGEALKTEVSAFKLVQPYPIELLVQTGKAVGNVLRLLSSIPVPDPSAPELPSFKVFEQLARLLAEALKWLAQKAGGALIGLADAIGSILESMLDVLRKVLKTALDQVSFEICLDAATFRLVQISLMPAYREGTTDNERLSFAALGVEIAVPRLCRPTLVLRFHDNDLVCAAFVVWLNNSEGVSLGTDLWLTNSEGVQQALTDQAAPPQDSGATTDPKPITSRLLELNAKLKGVGIKGIALAVLSKGKRRADFLQIVDQPDVDFIDFTVNHNKYQILPAAAAARFTPFDAKDLELDFRVQRDRILNLLGKSADGSEPSDSSGIFKELSQYIKITGGGAPKVTDKEVGVPLNVELRVAGSVVTTQLEVRAHIPTLGMRLTGAQAIQIRDKATVHELLGFQLRIDPREGTQLDESGNFPHFVLSFGDGAPGLSLAPEAQAEVSYKKVSRQGRGLVFDIDKFSISRDGLDLSAQIKKDPVILSGVDTPFRFTSGSLTIRRGKIIGASIAGTGQLPPKLVGEATAEIAITLGRGRNNDLIVESALGIFKPGTPLVCEGTRFRFQIDELGFTFAQDDSGYHFYFLLTGEAKFRPGNGEFRSGLLSNLSKTRIILRRVPLAGDGKALARCIEFQVPIDPPAKVNLFDIFKFQLKGIGFHPASPAFGGSPAMSISGQIAFVPSGDIPNVRIDLHQLLIAPPKEGDSMPRFRCDGLGVEVRASSSAKISATAMAVDDQTPSLYTGLKPDDGVTARGFLASGKLEITGWAPVRASMGFLEIRKRIDEHTEGPPRHAFFVYGQGERLAIQINIFGYDIFLQEIGFGFGYRYTLTGIAEADKVTNPQALVRVLDEVSKYQGNLHEFKAWRPEVDGDRITLAMRLMLALTGASQGGEWNEDGEKNLPANMLLFDIVAALRSDLTFLMTGRAWLCRTYGDWTFSEDSEPWKERPMMRGYLYLSVPRQTLLARVLADGTGEVGDHPPLFAPLKNALEVARWSSTLYVAPGIFHQEFGWPYELRFTLENDSKTFRLVVEGGMILRIAEGAVLNGVAFRARGLAVVGGRAGSSRLGASAEARAEFAIEAKLIAYVSTRRFGDTFFYGLLSLDVAVSFRVRVWLQIKIFRKRIRLEIGFSFGLSLSIALEAVVGAASPYVGARARVAVGVRGFGRNLTIGVGVRFNDGYLSEARTRVARFMTLGLGMSTPDPEQGLNTAPAPLPEPSRAVRAVESDKRLESRAQTQDDLGGNDLGSEMPGDEQDTADDVSRPNDPWLREGRAIGSTHYWALIYPTRRRDLADNSKQGESYILQIIPRDESLLSETMAADAIADCCCLSETPTETRESVEDDVTGHEAVAPSTFFASPPYRMTEEGTLLGTRPYDHRLVSNEGGIYPDLQCLRMLPPEANGDDPAPREATLLQWETEGNPDPQKPRVVNTHVNWNARVPQADKSVDLKVQHVIEDCFLWWNTTRPFTEPLPRTAADALTPVRLPKDPNSSAEVLHSAAHSREVLDDVPGDSAIVEERRSSIIGIVVESAARLAATGPDATGYWPVRDRSNGFDCRDLGLTFWITRAELDALFTEQAGRVRARFDVLTAVNAFDGDPGDGHGKTKFESGLLGSVHLLNPPDRFFETAQPTLAHQRKELSASGLALDWDLEPAWGASEGVFDDPEYVLKHYRIERRILNAQGVQTLRTVTIKPAAPVEFAKAATAKEQEKLGYTLKFLRPNCQFIDDFSDLPPALRAALLRLPGEVLDRSGTLVADRPEKVWERTFPKDAKARVLYLIVPVDIAGTEADATIIEYEIDPPITKLQPLRQVQLQVSYPTLSEAEKPPERAELLLTVLGDRDDETPDELGPELILRVRRSEIREGGTFGDDHVPPSDRINADSDAEILQSGDLDFVVELIAAPKPDQLDELIKVRYRPRNPDDSAYEQEDLLARVYPAALRSENMDEPQLESAAASAGQLKFRQALGLDGAQNAVVSVRLFALPFLRNAAPLQTKGLWRMVDLTLQVKQPATTLFRLRDPMIDVQVERFEHPVKATFRALHRSDMKASAGRLHTIYPTEGASLAEFVTYTAASQTLPLAVFRDPQRRSGVRLSWSAHPTALTYANTTIEPPRGIIGGFDIFSWNPDALPRAGTQAESLQRDVPRHCQYLGRVGVLPDSLRGLVPSEVGELSRVEASYPSETWRLGEAQKALRNSSSKARRARWFSPAESTPAWPLKLLRKQLVPLPDEMDITRCFSRGKPTRIEATFSKSPKGFDSWVIIGDPRCAVDTNTDAVQIETALSNGGSIWTPAAGKSLVNEVRCWLRSLTWAATSETDSDAIHAAFAKDSAKFRNVELTLTVSYSKGSFEVKIPIDFESRHHAVIEEMLCELRYEKVKVADTMYRRYEPVVEKVAKQAEPREWIGFLEETVEGPDPYGWGVLRAFGLAAGLRLYDTETGEFLSGRTVAERVQDALSAVLATRYKNECVRGDLGVPLVELITHPTARFEVSSYDGADPPADIERVRNDLCSFVQVSLRPAPQRLISEEANSHLRGESSPVHYLQLEFSRKPTPGDVLKLDQLPPSWSEHAADAMVLELDFTGGHFTGRPAASLAIGLDAAKLPNPDGLTSEIQVIQPLVPGDVLSAGTPPDPQKSCSRPLFAIARLTILGDGRLPLEELTKFLKDNVLPTSECLAITWLRHPQEEVTPPSAAAVHEQRPDAFERFPDLAPQVLATMIGGRGSVPGRGPVPPHAEWRRFYDVLASWGKSYENVIPGKGTIPRTPEQIETDWLEIATRLAPWGRRFLEHTISRRLEWKGDALRIPFAIATIPQPDPWRVTVDPNGTVDVLLIEKDRFGKRLRYALRPYGRYSAFEEAEKRTLQAADDRLNTVNNVVASTPATPFSLAPTLAGALDPPANFAEFEPWIDVTLPRTEPVATPVILSARRSNVSERRLELVVARPQDETLADANTAVEAAVSSMGIGLEFKREYTAREWTERIRNITSWQLEPLEAVAPMRPRQLPPPVAWEKSADVAELRKRVPDLWRGAIVYNFADIPYFYRTHVLVHAAAGIVVSDHAVATFPDGPSQLAWPQKAPEPSWTIVQDGIDGESRAAIVSFPLVRFRDCMSPEQIENWKRGSTLPKAWFVPEPSVNYTIALGTPASDAQDAPLAATAGEIELRPVDPEKKGEVDQPLFYFSIKIGTRFEVPSADLIPRLAPAAADLLNLEVPLRCVSDELPTPPQMWPATWTANNANFDHLALMPAQIGVLCLHLPVREMKISVDRFTIDNLTRLPAAALSCAARIEEMRTAVPADPQYNHWGTNYDPGIQKALAIFKAIAGVDATKPEEEWQALINSGLGSVVGNSYELNVVFPAGKLLLLPDNGELRQVYVAPTWAPPDKPPHGYDYRAVVDREFATNDANGKPHVNVEDRRAIRRNLRHGQIAARRVLFENPTQGFAPLKEAAKEGTAPPAPDVWRSIEERTFDAMYVIDVVVPDATQTAAREALLRAFDQIPSATDAILQLGALEDGVPTLEPKSGVSLPVLVPVRHVKHLVAIGYPEPGVVASYVLRRPATRDELAHLTDARLREVIGKMIPAQVFGAGRRPLLQVSRAREALLPRPIVQSG